MIEVTPERNFRVLESNPALESFIGRTEDELIGRFVEDVAPPERASAFTAKLHHCIEVNGPCEADLHPDPMREAQSHQCRTTLVPIRHSKCGRIHRIVGIVHDLPEHRHYRDSPDRRGDLRRRLTHLARQIPGFLFTYAEEKAGPGRFLYISPGIEKLLGLRADLVLDNSALYFDRIPATDATRLRQEMSDAAKNRETCLVEHSHIHCDGRELRLQFRARPEIQNDSCIVWHGVCHEVRKQQDAPPQSDNHTFSILARDLPDYLVRFDRESRIVTVNPALESTLGVPAKDFVGHRPRELGRHPNLDECLRLEAIVRDVFDSGIAQTSEARLPSAKGGTGEFEVRHIPERDANGKVVSVLGIARDLTHLRETQRSLFESYRRFSQLSGNCLTAREEERKHVANELHDDLGQLVTSQRLQLGVLKFRFGHGNPALVESIQHLSSTNDSIVKAVRRTLAALRPEIISLGIMPALKWLTDEFLAYSDVELMVRTECVSEDFDENQTAALFRIAQESLTNIARHANATVVEIALKSDGDNHHLSIRDNGNGFDPSQPCPHSFGLSGIRERAFLLGGHVRIESAPGRGAAIDVLIPRRHKDNNKP